MTEQVMMRLIYRTAFKEREVQIRNQTAKLYVLQRKLTSFERQMRTLKVMQSEIKDLRQKLHKYQRLMPDVDKSIPDHISKYVKSLN